MRPAWLAIIALGNNLPILGFTPPRREMLPVPR
jgi:hypothetical protein